MTANIFGNRFYGHRTPAWHKDGIVNDVPQDARTTYGMLTPYWLELRPVSAVLDGVAVEMPNTRVIVRGPVPDDGQERFFGIVSNDYRLIEPQMVCDVFDRVSGGLTVETMGSLGMGEMFFLTADVGAYDVLGKDEQRRYLFFACPYIPGKAHSIIDTNVRVVCQNTWHMAEARGRYVWAGRHNDHRLAEKLEIWMEHSIRAAMHETDASKQFAELLARSAIAKEQVYEALFRIYPDPEPVPANYPERLRDEAMQRYTLRMQRNIVTRDAIERLYVGEGKGSNLFPGTAWSLYQSVVEFEDYRAERGGQATSSIVMGNRALRKDSARNIITALVKRG